MLELLRPPPHRGPLIAAGAVLLAVGVVLVRIRLDSDLVHALSAGALAAFALGLGLQVRSDQGAPYAFQSVLLVTGCLAFALALQRLGDEIGADPLEERWATVVATALTAGVATVAAFKRDSAACLLIAAIAAVAGVLGLWDLVFEPAGPAPFRWLLLLCGAALVLAALVLRAGRYRHSVQLVNAAGLCVIAMGLSFLGVTFLFGFGEVEVATGWELVALACGCGLIAFGAVDRQPGPALLGIALLGLFVAMTGDGGQDTLMGWPLAILALGVAVVLAGLRPRRPLPPEPEAYRAGDLPLAARSADDTSITSVRVD